MQTGIRAKDELGRNTGIKLAERGGFVVDESYVLFEV